MRMTCPKLLPFMLLLFLLSGCAAGKTVKNERYFWPPPPSEPKIEWIGVYYDETSIQGNEGSKLLQAILGAESDLRFISPLFVASNATGRVVVSDPDVKGFINIDQVNKKFSLLGESLMAGVVKPTGIDFDAEGRVYAGDDPTRKVYVVGSDNKVLNVLDLSAEIKSVGGMVIDKKLKRIIIPDPRENKVAVFSLDGKLLFKFGQWGDLDGQFNQPMSAALDSQGNIYIADSFNARIQRFSPDGTFLSKFGKRGDGLADFGIIKSLALDSDDNIYVTDAKFHRIQIFNGKGELLLTLGAPHAQKLGESIVAAGLLLPYGIYIDSSDRIYVADMMNRRLQVFQYFPDKKQVK